LFADAGHRGRSTRFQSEPGGGGILIGFAADFAIGFAADFPIGLGVGVPIGFGGGSLVGKVGDSLNRWGFGGPVIRGGILSNRRGGDILGPSDDRRLLCWRRCRSLQMMGGHRGFLGRCPRGKLWQCTA
jgi:hypothetical protein